MQLIKVKYAATQALGGDVTQQGCAFFAVLLFHEFFKVSSPVQTVPGLKLRLNSLW